MSAAVANGHSILKDCLLKLWIPVVGVRTPFEFVRKNCEKFLKGHSHGQTEILPLIVYEIIRSCTVGICEAFFIDDRRFANCFDTEPPFQLNKAILTGSLSEGLFLFAHGAPDVDFMCVLGNIMFSQKDQEGGCLSLKENTPFVNAYVLEKETKQAWKEFLHDGYKEDGRQQISSRKLKEKLEVNYQKSCCRLFQSFMEEKLETLNEGAAVTISKPEKCYLFEDVAIEFFRKVLFQPFNTLTIDVLERLFKDFDIDNIESIRSFSSSDIVLCIFCEGWPSCAQEWITRERLWPDAESVKVISHGGFHIVPKSSPDGDFRLSFTSAETMLIKSLTPLRFKVMKAFKGVVKYHQNFWNANAKEIISSYHLKTIAFWYLEKTSQEMWTDETVVHHLLTLLKELAEALRTQNLPMFFMPKVNLLDYNNPEEILDLIENILKLGQNFSTMSEALKSCNMPYFYKFSEMIRREKNELVEKTKLEEGKCSECLFTFLKTINGLNENRSSLFQSYNPG